VDERWEELIKVCQAMGLHPLVGFGMVAIDLILFVGAVITLGASTLIAIPVALLLVIPCTLVQKYWFNDNLEAAIVKGVAVGLLTAIPTPLPSIVTLVGGLLGAGRLLIERQQVNNDG